VILTMRRNFPNCRVYGYLCVDNNISYKTLYHRDLGTPQLLVLPQFIVEARKLLQPWQLSEMDPVLSCRFEA
jgi:hypothetical protein